ncbi:unnamed protein product, partial [Linum tenue]
MGGECFSNILVITALLKRWLTHCRRSYHPLLSGVTWQWWLHRHKVPPVARSQSCHCFRQHLLM